MLQTKSVAYLLRQSVPRRGGLLWRGVLAPRLVSHRPRSSSRNLKSVSAVAGFHTQQGKDENDDGTDMQKTWVDNVSPSIQPFLKLARMDRPIGTYLCLLPALWGLSLSAPGFVPDLTHVGTFVAGAFLVRGAGCTINDILDVDIDRQVERTRKRPLASGQLSIPQAVGFLGLQLSAGLALLLTLNEPTILLGCICVPLIGVYPLMKRVTDYPQAWLGVCFNWGVLMGATTSAGWDANQLATLALFASSWSWTMIYDTIYAHMDKKDDAKVGVRSSARALGASTKNVLAALAVAQTSLLATAGYLADSGPLFYAVGVGGAAAHLAWQIYSVDLDDFQSCLEKFRANRHLGSVVLLGIVLGHF